MVRKIHIKAKPGHLEGPKAHHPTPGMHQIQDKAIHAMTDEMRSKNPLPKVGLWIGLGATVLVALLIFFIQYQKENERRRTESIALQDVQRSAEAAYTTVQKAMTHVEQMAAEAHKIDASAEETLRAIEALTPGAVRRQKTPVPQPAAAPTATAAAAPAPAPETPAPAAQPAHASKDDAGIPTGLLPSREEVIRWRETERQRRSGVGAKPPAPAAATAAQGAPAAAPAAADAGDQDAGAEPHYGPGVAGQAEAVKAGAQFIDLQLAELRDVHNLALEMRGKIAADLSLINARRSYANLTDYAGAAGKVEKDVSDRLVEIRDRAKAMQTVKDDATKKHDEEVARVDKERQEREQQERLATEKQMAEQLRKDGVPLLQKNRFEEALEAIRSRRGDYRTEPGKAAVNLLIARAERILGLKKFLVREIQAAPLGFGWVQDGQPLDIRGADDNGINLKSKTVAWADVSTPQLLKLIKFYCTSNAVKRSERGAQDLATALLFHECGKDDIAGEFKEQATKLAPELAEEMQRLMGP